MLFVEEAGACVLQIEHADDAALVKERHDQLRARLGIHGEVARIFAHVGHIDGPPLAHGRAYQAAGDGDAPQGRMRIAEAPGIAGDERLAFVIEQHDGEHLVVDEAAQQLADALEQRIEIEDRSQLGGDFVQHCERLRLARDARVEARVLDSLGDARGGQREQVQVLGAKVVGLLAFDVHHADEAVLGDQRHGQLGANVGIGRDVVLASWRCRSAGWAGG